MTAADVIVGIPDWSGKRTKAAGTPFLTFKSTRPSALTLLLTTADIQLCRPEQRVAQMPEINWGTHARTYGRTRTHLLTTAFCVLSEAYAAKGNYVLVTLAVVLHEVPEVGRLWPKHR